MLEKICKFAIANKMVVIYSERATVIAQYFWAFFVSILYPHIAVSLCKIMPFGGVSSC